VSHPHLIRELLQAWARGLPADEHGHLDNLLGHIAHAIDATKVVPVSLDRRCLALVVTKLEEAEHWALAAMREAVDRADRKRADSDGT
jgi:hypothetical protein